MAVLLAAIGAACGTNPVSHERNDAVGIPAGATVAFRGHAEDAAARLDSAVSNDSVHRWIQGAITTQLRRKGYTVVDSGRAATFTVRYFLSAGPAWTGFAPAAGGLGGPQVGGRGGWQFGQGPGTQSDVGAVPIDTVRQVSFEVSLVDEKAGRTAWRGMYAAEPKQSPPSQARINALAAEIFQSLPPVPGATPTD